MKHLILSLVLAAAGVAGIQAQSSATTRAQAPANKTAQQAQRHADGMEKRVKGNRPVKINKEVKPMGPSQDLTKATSVPVLKVKGDTAAVARSTRRNSNAVEKNKDMHKNNDKGHKAAKKAKKK
ncbi:MAG: hypothetical protein MJZ74_06605 [Muribaculaceae bacterium]|nr:hypothetical protein [Muribaculaceae bacterium]